MLEQKGSSSEKPARRRFLVYDFEWIPGTLEIRLCGVYDGNRYTYYYTVRAFCGGILNAKNSGAWFFAHFGGGADFQFVLQELVSCGATYRVRGSFSGSSAIIVEVRRGNYVWTFVDSYWLLRDSLANIGKWLGIEKGDGVKHTREWYADAPLNDLIVYNERDCEILYKAVVEFESTLMSMGGSLKKTIAGCAMELFKARYLKRDIHTNATVNLVAREAYCASRVEVFETTCETANYYDVNSSFPFAMTFPAPGSLVQTHSRLSDRLMYAANNAPFLVLLDYETADDYVPPLPYRLKGRIFFPVGRRQGWLTNIDLAVLVKAGGTIHRVYEVLEFEPFSDLAEYATDIFARRQKTEGFERLVYKYLLNSLYGKFGESPEGKQTLYLNPSETVLGRLNRETDMLLPGLWIETITRYVPHEHVPIAAHITAIARRTLYDLLSSASRVYYCDTDGFATDSEFDTGPGLGQLKLEKQIVSGRFVAPKLYDLNTVDGKHIIKGKGFSLNGDESRYEAVIAGQGIEVERMHRIRENLTRGHCRPRESTMRKTFLGKVIPKRFFYPDGRSRPWTIDELKTID